MFMLSVEWCNRLSAQRETGMGYQIATVLLKDGRRFERVTIVDGRITLVHGDPEIPFVEKDIAAIEVSGISH